MRNLTAQEQVVRGIEYLALAQYYFHGKSEVNGPYKKRKRRRKDQSAPVDQSFARVHDGRITSTLLSELVYALHGDHSLKQKPSSRERQMRLHAKATFTQFPALENERSQAFSKRSLQTALCSYYLYDYKMRESMGFVHNDSAIESYVLSVSLRDAEDLASDFSIALLELIILRHAIQEKFRIEIKIREHKASRFLRCFVVALETCAQQLYVIVYDPDRQDYRRIVLTDMEVLNHDLWKLWQTAPRSNEDYSLIEAEKQLLRDETKVTLIMPADYYPRFLRHSLAPVDIISRSSHVIRLQVRSMSTLDVEQLLYPHMDYIDVEPRALKEQIYSSMARKARRASGSA